MAQWTIRYGGKDYVAPDRATLLEWLRADHIKNDTEVFDPVQGVWTTAEAVIRESAKDVVLSTTETVAGHRIVKYLGVESGESGTHVFTLKFGNELNRMHGEALDVLRQRVVIRGGNAAVAVRVNFFPYTDYGLFVVATGTAVVLEPFAEA
jgi:uncharacterized protein YbjQ (UPF0145 family)